jgi:HK97 gp10 family phage protein
MSTFGYEKARAKFRALPPAVRANLKVAVVECANRVEALASALAPEDSGDLKESVRVVQGEYTPANSRVRSVVVSGKADPDLTASVVAGDEKAWYAALVEHGTVRTRAQPHLFPAYRALKRAIRARLNRAYRDAAKTIMGRS